jgi:hypothetical protein
MFPSRYFPQFSLILHTLRTVMTQMFSLRRKCSHILARFQTLLVSSGMPPCRSLKAHSFPSAESPRSQFPLFPLSALLRFPPLRPFSLKLEAASFSETVMICQTTQLPRCSVVLRLRMCLVRTLARTSAVLNDVRLH